MSSTTLSVVDNKTLVNEYKQYKIEQEALQEQYDIEKTKYEEAQKLLDTYTKEYDSYQKEIEEVNAQILADQERQQIKQEEQMDSLINKAINSYNKEEDGDFNAYLQKTMDNNGFPIYSNINSLNSNSTLLSDKAKYVLNNITMQSSIVANLKTSLNSISSELNVVTEKLNNVASKITTTSVSDVQSVQNVTEVSEVTETETTQETTATTKVELKTMDEYIEIANAKIDAVLQKCNGNINDARQYIDNNMIDIIDADGDGKVSYIDQLIWDNVKLDYSKLGDRKNEWTQNGESYIRTHEKIFSNIWQATRFAAKDTLLDLNDVENLYKLRAENNINSPLLASSFIINQMDIPKIVQEDNWEERLQNIDNRQFHAQLNYTPVNHKDGEIGVWTNYKSPIDEMRSKAEFIQQNPDKAQYCGIAENYKNTMEVYNSVDWNQLATDDYNSNLEAYNRIIQEKSSDTYKKCVKLIESAKKNNAAAANMTVEELVYNTVFEYYQTGEERKQAYYEGHCSCSYNLSDFNGDGTIDAKDIAAFSTEVDLDCDGTVSDSERQYLANIKEKFTSTIARRQINQCAFNTASIDDLISTLENIDENAYTQEAINKTISGHEERLKSDMDYQNNFYVSVDNPLTMEDMLKCGCDWPHVVGHTMSYLTGASYHLCITGYKDGTSIGLNALEDISNFGELFDAIPIVAEAAKPTNSYIHYIKSADLSKSELQEILSKINSASTSAQSQLAEVKKVVEEKLAQFE